MTLTSTPGRTSSLQAATFGPYCEKSCEVDMCHCPRTGCYGSPFVNDRTLVELGFPPIRAFGIGCSCRRTRHRTGRGSKMGGKPRSKNISDSGQAVSVAERVLTTPNGSKATVRLLRPMSEAEPIWTCEIRRPGRPTHTVNESAPDALSSLIWSLRGVSNALQGFFGTMGSVPRPAPFNRI